MAEEAGFDHLWNFDHLAGVKSSGLESPIFEAWTLLAAMAEATSRIRIGCLVTGNAYRHPAMLAKIAVTVDHLSDGRLEFGIGAGGWPEREHSMYGIKELDHLTGRLGEALQVFKALWTEDRADLSGQYYSLNKAIANPKPVQKPHPPIWIGTVGPATLLLTARYADVWNVTASFVSGPEEAFRLDDLLTETCHEVGRDPETVRRSAQIFWDATDRSKLIEDVAVYVERGFSDIIVFPDVRATGRDIVGATHKAADELATLRALPRPHAPVA